MAERSELFTDAQWSAITELVTETTNNVINGRVSRQSEPGTLVERDDASAIRCRSVELVADNGHVTVLKPSDI